MIPSSTVIFDMIHKDLRFRLVFLVDEEGMLLREFLHSKGISKRTLTATKYEGGMITVNGHEQNVRHRLQVGDKVAIIFPPEQPSEGLQPEEGPLDIIYEDEAILVLNKAPGQSTIPSRDHPTGTVANYVAGKFVSDGLPATVHVVTRLDKDTSGLICIAKNRHIHHLLSEQMMSSGFHRQYIAIVEGHVKDDQFTIQQPIGRKDGSIIERMVREDGQSARTDVKVQHPFTKDGHELTTIALVLHTGRTHQIRVHLQWAGYPLTGDDLYGGTLQWIQRQALHCAVLRFKHPVTGADMQFESDMPADMQSVSRIL
ncbi:RluA family pseudouridine synthase [Sporosarcina sp. YIM B06819]|uniref:RluA family pseudouridine synthase n=1 Tax=Sporosarcina sp. YIM B06819 TaxID=3081769 RepID=UPI00298BE98A|nr:RluA family pseudouridine synthase [Sporosarcina sp. YIM B06819]